MVTIVFLLFLFSTLLLILQVGLCKRKLELDGKLHSENMEILRHQYEGDIPKFLSEFEKALDNYAPIGEKIINDYLKDIDKYTKSILYTHVQKRGDK